MIKFRPSKKKDSSILAELINIASEGTVEYLFHDLIPESTPVQVVSYNLENDHFPHSYKSAIVALDEEEIVGMILSYPSSFHQITDEMKNFFPHDRLHHFYHFFSSRVEKSWFVDAICVIESHRRQGIGEKLISLAKEKAIESGYNSLSLIVFVDNLSAISVYRRFGFETVKKVELQGNEYMMHEGGCLLMQCKINI